MANIEGLNPNATRAEVEDELVFTRILLESLDSDAFEYEELMAQHTQKIAQLEALLSQMDGGHSAGVGSSPVSQDLDADFQNYNGQDHFGDLEQMMAPIADYNAVTATGRAQNGIEHTGKSHLFSVRRSRHLEEGVLEILP